MIALAILVAGAATVAPAIQIRATALQTAGTTGASATSLFDSKGRYRVNTAALTLGATFQFFGYDWEVVYVNMDESGENGKKIATFWMADPYESYVFDQTTRSGNGIYTDGANIWANGYTQTKYGDIKIGQSKIREFLIKEAKTIIDAKKYKSYANKVVAGHVKGTNEENDMQTVKNLSFAEGYIDEVKQWTGHSLEAYYGLTSEDRLWLPSMVEVFGANYWNLEKEDPDIIGWTETTISGKYAWLRSPDTDESEYAAVVSYKKLNDDDAPTTYSYSHSLPIKQAAGVRPAIHLDITNIEAEYLDSVENPAKEGGNSWWDDDWLKALFMVVCILGILGVGLVIIAVVAKSRQNKNQA